MRFDKKIALKMMLLFAGGFPLAAEELVVIVKPALVVRESPDTKAKALGRIPYLGKVPVISKKTETVSLMGVTGSWTQVTFEGKNGWVFGAFLGKDGGKRFFEIIAGTAQERDPDKCITLKTSDFPKFFTGGCVGQTCDQGCGHFILRDDGVVSTRDGCDGVGGSGKWIRKGSQILIEYSVIPMPPEDLCAYKDGSRECIRGEEQKYMKECGKKSGCVRKRRKVLEMPRDDQFTIDGENVCIYP